MTAFLPKIFYSKHCAIKSFAAAAPNQEITLASRKAFLNSIIAHGRHILHNDTKLLQNVNPRTQITHIFRFLLSHNPTFHLC